jgi:hypothetical protein
MLTKSRSGQHFVLNQEKEMRKMRNLNNPEDRKFLYVLLLIPFSPIIGVALGIFLARITS